MTKLIKNPFLYYIIKFKKYFLLGIAALVITDVSDVLTPYILGLLLDSFLENQNFRNSHTLFIIFIAASLTNALARYSWRIFFAKFHHNTAYDLKLNCFKAFFDKDLLNYNSQSTGDKMSVFNKDVENFRMGIGPGLLILFDGILYLILIPLAMWKINPEWTIIVLVFMPVIPVVMALMEKFLNKLFDQQQKHLSELSSLAQESIEGIKVIKSFRMAKLREHLYNVENENLYKTSTKVEFVHSSFSPLFDFFISISCAVLLFVVAGQPDLKTVQVGSLFAFYQYLRRMTWPLAALGFSYMMVTEAKSSFRRIKKVLTKEPQTYDKEPLITKKEIIKVKRLNFSYPDQSLVYKNINLSINQNRSYLIAGATKSGKSTLLKLLSELHSPESGTVFKRKDQDFAYNPQTPFLFMDNIKENIILNFDTDVVHSDFKKIAFYDELMSMDELENTEIGEKGANLSGGQKQRLSLLRAIKSDKSCLLLDEPISAVDEVTKTNIVSTLKSLAEEKTLIISTSNPEHFLWMSDVILIEEGVKSNQRTVVHLNMKEALKNKTFKTLVKKNREIKDEV